jgi:phosphate transport system substrate-binding protein
MEKPSRRKINPGVVASIAVLAVIAVSYLALTDKIFGPFDGFSDEDWEFEEIFFEDDPEGVVGEAEAMRLPKETQGAKTTDFTLGDAVRNNYADIDESDTPEGRGYYRFYGTYPYIDGSSACVPMQAGFAMRILGLTGDSPFKFSTMYSSHREAIRNLIEKRAGSNAYLNDDYYKYYAYKEDGNYYLSIPDRPVDLYLGTAPSDKEVAFSAKNGVSLIQKPVALDAFVFVVHKDNPVGDLTMDQARGIYTGKITNWKEVGGRDEKIFPFQREEDTDSQIAMENLVMNGESMIGGRWYEEAFDLSDDLGVPVMYKIKRDSIGYTLRVTLDTMYGNIEYKILKINGVAPTDDTVRDGSYPLTVELYGVIRGEDADGTGGKFLDWILSDDGQDCVGQVGYVPVMGRQAV